MGKLQYKKEMDCLKTIPKYEERVIVVTGRYIGKGFDDARLDALILTMPVSWKGTLIQYIGRLHRTYDWKHEVQVFDYLDTKIPNLKKMFEKRANATSLLATRFVTIIDLILRKKMFIWRIRTLQ